MSYYGYYENYDDYGNHSAYYDISDGTVYGYDYPSYEDNDRFIYEVLSFEWTVYLYVWGVLVVLTTLANILVITVFIRKRMRNSTNVILMSIAVTDSLTGVVTLPVYIYVYSTGGKESLSLSENWCEAFMLVKNFVSQSFHTMSIWLTVCLGFQRLVAVRFPFRAHSMFTIPKTLIMVLLIVIASPLVHIYHVLSKKTVVVREEQAVIQKCTWKLEEPCVEGCIYMWIRFYMVHFIPCLLLVVFTAIMVAVLCRNVQKMQTSASSGRFNSGRRRPIPTADTTDRRTADSRRISIIVVVVVVVFLIPEVPYGLYVLLSVMFHLSRVGLGNLETNRAFHCVYEVSLVLSFHANFWIYFVMNRRFRRSLRHLFMPVGVLCCGIVGTIRRGSSFRRRTGSSSLGSNPRTQPTSGGHEMNTYTGLPSQHVQSADQQL